MNIKRGDIYYADLSPVVGSEQGGLRPVLIVQNDIGNRYSPTVIAAAITSRLSKAKLPTHIDIMGSHVGLSKDSVILLEQIRTLDKRRLREKMGHLDEETMTSVNNAIEVSFGLSEREREKRAVDKISLRKSERNVRNAERGVTSEPFLYLSECPKRCTSRIFICAYRHRKGVEDKILLFDAVFSGCFYYLLQTLPSDPQP